MRKPSESDLVRACLQLLKLRGILAWRQNTGAARYRRKDGEERFVPFGRKGQADITGILRDGRRLEVEVKMPGRGLTRDQKIFLDDIRARNGLALVVRDLRDLEEALRREGVTGG